MPTTMKGTQDFDGQHKKTQFSISENLQANETT